MIKIIIIITIIILQEKVKNSTNVNGLRRINKYQKLLIFHYVKRYRREKRIRRNFEGEQSGRGMMI